MITIHDCEQGTEAWYRARLGLPTASEFSTVMASGRGGGDSKTRRTYMLKLAGEIITGEPMESFSNAHMDRGKEMEAEAREQYAFDNDVEPLQVGFVTNGRRGCSPDSLIGASGGLEIKTKLPHLFIEALLRGDAPPEHRAQTQGQLLVLEREWIDLKIYWPRMPRLVHRTYRDEAYIKGMGAAIDEFNHELDEMVARVRAHGGAGRLAA